MHRIWRPGRTDDRVIPGFLAQTLASALCFTEMRKPSTGQQVWERGARVLYWEYKGNCCCTVACVVVTCNFFQNIHKFSSHDIEDLFKYFCILWIYYSLLFTRIWGHGFIWQIWDFSKHTNSFSIVMLLVLHQCPKSELCCLSYSNRTLWLSSLLFFFWRSFTIWIK